MELKSRIGEIEEKKTSRGYRTELYGASLVQGAKAIAGREGGDRKNGAEALPLKP